MSGGRVTLAHGAGGVETEELLRRLFLRLPPVVRGDRPGWVGVSAFDDGAAVPLPGGGWLVFTSDSYTVSPIFFPGGDIGRLAASGTINDLLMMGAEPVAVVDNIVVEEGFPLSDLERIVDSLASTLAEAGAALVGGDFKVMPKGGVDGIVIGMAGVGFCRWRPIVDRELRPGDRIIVTGPLGEHGAVILAYRLGVEPRGLRSDVRPLHDLMLPLLREYRGVIHAARDPTRGGLAMTLNDWAEASGTLIVIDEERVPIRDEVRAYADMIGVDPLALASEGVAVLGVEGSRAGEVLEFIRSLGFREAEIIGEVRASERFAGRVVVRTSAGGLRVLEPPRGELVPRIC